MKILLITASLDERSGWGRHARAIGDELHSQGEEVMFCSGDGSPKYLSYETGTLKPLSVRSFFGNIMRVRVMAKTADVVHALDGWPLALYGWLAVLGTGKRFFVNGVGTYSVAPLYATGKRWLLLRAYRRAEKIFCISSYTAKQMLSAGAPSEKMEVVHFGAPEAISIPVSEAIGYRAQYGISQDAYPIVLTVGAIKDRKGQFDTLRAVGQLKDQFPNILYIVAGAVHQPAYLIQMKSFIEQARLGENVRIIHDADDRVIAFLYSMASVLALNSTSDPRSHHFEGFGAVIAEGYQYGLPAVGSSDSGIEDAIFEGETGYLAKQGDPESIADRIREAVNNRISLAEGIRRHTADFSWRTAVAQYRTFYHG